jgi:hypothetical protein
MNNFKQKVLAGLLAPALALAVGSAFAQSSGTTGSQGSSATQGSAAGGSATGSTNATGSTTTTGTSGSSAMSGGTSGGSNAMWNTQHFNRLDKNNDGRISREEAQGDNALRDAWSKLDASNSGSVSREDFDKYARTLNPNSSNPMQNNVPGKGPQK